MIRLYLLMFLAMLAGAAVATYAPVWLTRVLAALFIFAAMVLAVIGAAIRLANAEPIVDETGEYGG